MKHIYFITIWIFTTSYLIAQNPSDKQKQEAPAFRLLRADENYSILKKKEDLDQKSFIERIKFIPLSKNKDAYLTLGGQVRPRFEYFSNRMWEDEDVSFYSQRINLHANVQLSENIRVFSELYHGYTSHEREILNYDQLNVHQGFIEAKLPLKSNSSLAIRFGRQEMGFGATRLVGLRNGPNIRRSFDAALE